MKRLLAFVLLNLGLGSSGLLTQASAYTDPDYPSIQCQQARLQTLNMASLPNLLFCRDQQGASPASSTIPATKFLALSLQGSALLQSQRDLVDSAVYSLKSANGAWWPNVSMSNSSLLFVNNSGNNNSNVEGCTNNPSTAGKSFNPFNGSSSSCSAASQYTQAYPVITITWNFINPSRYPQIAGAKKGISLAKSQLKQTNQQLQLSLLKSYGTYLLAGFQLGELTSLIKIENKLLDVTSRLVDNRALPRYSRNQESRNLLSYQARIQSVIAMQKQAKAEMAAALDKATPDQRAMQPDLGSLVVKQWTFDEAQTTKMALQNSEQLKQLGLQSGISTDSANQLRGSILPTIGFLGYVTYQGTDSAGSYSGILSNYAGLSLSWNLFDGYSTKNQAISADRQASSYLQQKADSERQLRLLVQSKMISLRSLSKQISIYLHDINQTQFIAGDLAKREKYGLSTFLDVLQAQQDSHESRLQLISAITSYVMTYTELSYLCGIDPLA
jgi:outer membrane protein TolC